MIQSDELIFFGGVGQPPIRFGNSIPQCYPILRYKNDITIVLEKLFIEHGMVNMCPPSDVCWSIKPMNTIVIGIMNHIYGSYKPT